jgi:hypothetical protein
MTRFPRPSRVLKLTLCGLALALVAGAGRPDPAGAQPGFPRIPTWSFAGGFRQTTGADSIVRVSRKATFRFLRDRRAEARPDFGGYRIYRVTNTPDTSAMVLLRRYSLSPGDEITWHFSRVDPVSLEFKDKQGNVVHDSVATFVDSDSSGNYIKVCRFRDDAGRCLSRGDSVFVLVAPPGPHDGFITYYSVTYEARNPPGVATNQDLYVAGRDTLDDYARCAVPGDSSTCPIINMNRKDLNLTVGIEPTRGPQSDVEGVRIVPNPYRASEVWDQPGQSEIHFTNLPSQASIRIFTLAGDLVRELDHNDSVRDFARWDLKNADGRDVASGVYMVYVTSGSFAFTDRFVVIR